MKGQALEHSETVAAVVEAFSGTGCREAGTDPRHKIVWCFYQNRGMNYSGSSTPIICPAWDLSA